MSTKQLFVWASLGLAALQAGYFACIEIGTPVWPDIAVFVAFGFGSGILSVSQFQIIGDVVHNSSMTSFYGTLSAVVQLGALVGAGMVAALGRLDFVHLALLLDAGTFIFVAILVWNLAIDPVLPSAGPTSKWASISPLLPLTLVGTLPAITISVLNTSLAEIVRVFADGRTEFVGYVDICFSLAGLATGLFIRKFAGKGSAIAPALFLTVSLLAVTVTTLNIRVVSRLQQLSARAVKAQVASLTLLTNLAFVGALSIIGLTIPNVQLELYFAVLALAAGILLVLHILSRHRVESLAREVGVPSD